MVEKQSRFYLKSLKIDRGGEFNAKEFWIFYKSNDIRKELIMSYTSQQNVVVDMMNRTVDEVARCMLVDKYLPY